LSKTNKTSQKRSTHISFAIAIVPLVLSYPIAAFLSGLFPHPAVHTDLNEIALALYQCTDSLRTTILTAAFAQTGILLAAIYRFGNRNHP
jgi:hypothetical protein